MASLAIKEVAYSPAEMAGMRRSRRRRWVLVCLVSLGGVALSVLLAWFLSVREQTLTKMQFKIDAGERIASLKATMADRLGALDTVAAFFCGSQAVSRQKFHTFTNPLIARHRGMEMVGWAPRVKTAQRESHEQAVRADGGAEYQITQRDGQGRFVMAENRGEYYPLQFVETLNQSQTLLGFDLGSNPYCAYAIQQAMTTRHQAAVICSPLEGSEADHSLLYVVTPVWNERTDAAKAAGETDGFAIGVFRVCTMVEAALSLFPPTAIDIFFTGPPDASGKKPLYARLSALRSQDPRESQLTDSSLAPEGGMHETDTIDVAGNRCTVDCVPLEDYLARQRTWGPLSALLAGLVITGLLVGYLFLLTGRTQHVERLEAERAAELQSVSNSVLDAVIFMDAEGRIAHWNPAAERIFGYSYDEIAGRYVHETLVPERYREAAKGGMLAFARNGQGAFVGKVVELAALRKNGSEFSIESSVSPILMEGGWGAVAIIRDVTDRKRAEEILKRERRLLRDMLDLHERDRKLVAYEIHDGLAQQLTAAVFRFQSVDPSRESGLAEGREMFEEGLRLLRQAMVETRRLISGLRPPVLDELGVVAAIQCLVDEKQQNGNPKIEFIHDPELERLAAPLESSAFRIVQECLTNACRYSKSDKVRVELGRREGRLLVEVQDWGIGFEPEKVNGGHYGLRGIHERARLLGGDVTVQTAPQQGTLIRVVLPLIVQSDEGIV